MTPWRKRRSHASVWRCGAARCRNMTLGVDGKGWDGMGRRVEVMVGRLGFLFETEKHQETAIPWYIGKWCGTLHLRKIMGWQVMIRGKYSQKYVSEPLATLCYAMLRCYTPHLGEKQHGAEHLQGYGWTIGDSSGSRCCLTLNDDIEPTLKRWIFFEPQMTCCHAVCLTR